MKKSRSLKSKEAFKASAIPVLGTIMARQYRKKIGMTNDFESNTRLMRLGFEFGRQCFKRNPERQKLVWVNLPNISELFYAFNVIPYTPEPFGGSLAAMGQSGLSLDEAYSMGFSRDTCTFCNHVIGADNLEQLPRPDMIFSTMFTLCDAQGKAFEAVARRLNIPFNLIHLPTMNNRKSAIEFFVGELKNAIEILEDLTKSTFDLQALKKAIRLSNEAVTYYRKFLDLRKATPTCISGVDGFHLNVPLYNFMGDQQVVVDFFKTLYQEAKNHVENFNSNHQSNGRQIRLLNAGHYFPLYDSSLLRALEKEDVYFVSETFAATFWNQVPEPKTDTPEDWLRSLARKYLSLPTVGSFKQRAAINHYLSKEWKVDGAVHFLPWGCRVISSSARAIADYMEKQLNVPSLIIDSDPIDKSIYAKGSVATRLHAFAEMLGRKKNNFKEKI